jgi:sidestep protein, putative
VVRGKVALPCDVTAPTLDDSVALVLWYKDDALAPIYTLDARKGKYIALKCIYTFTIF